jgi:uncharacterized membrane protein (UPF0127 family)
MAPRLIALNTTREVTLANRIRHADRLLSRLVGLLRDRELVPGDGLWIVPCNSIHSFGMRFAFDAIFLDRELRVVRLMPEMKPWRVSALVLSAHSVLELPAGTIVQSGTQMGDQLKIEAAQK